MGSSRTSRLAPEATRIASERRRCSPPEISARSFSDSATGEQECPEQVAGPLGAQPGLALRRLEHGARAGRLLGVLGEIAEPDLVSEPDAARRGGAPPGDRLDQGRLAGAVGTDQDDVLAALEVHARLLQQGPARDLDSALLHLNDDPAGALRCREGEAQVATLVRLGNGPVALDLLDPLQTGLGLPCLGRLVAESLDESLHPRDLGLLALDRTAERELPCGLLGAPGVPGPGEVTAAAGLQLEHRGANRLEEPAVVGDQDDRRLQPAQMGFQPFQRRYVEMVGGLVEQQ